MSVNDLPIEVLMNIFQYLDGLETVKCREVCRRWRDVVDALPDSFWRRLCWLLDLCYMEDYEIVQKKYQLRWFDVYKTFNTWQYIREAAVMNIYEAPTESIKYIKVLHNNIVAMLTNERYRFSYEYADTVIYYNVETQQECGREEFDFLFCSRQFEENEHFWVLIQPDGTLSIIPKATREEHCVGTLTRRGGLLQLFSEEHFLSLTVIDNEVYFQDVQENVIYVSKLVENKGNTLIVTEPITEQEFEQVVIYFAKYKEVLFILTDKGKIFKPDNKVYKLVSQLEHYYYNKFDWDSLRSYGFNWKIPAIYNWLVEEDSMVNINPLYNALYAHGNVILAAETNSTVVNICVNTYMCSELRELYDVVRKKTQRKIDMKLFVIGCFKCIKQLDIIENGVDHKVLVLAQGKLFIFDFQYYEKHKQSMLLRSKTDNENIKKVTAKKVKKKYIGKVKASSMTHKYATRSSTKHNREDE